MNVPQIRKVNPPPPTPNLEQIKQKNKSKSRRKPCHMQPTNPPTPKMNRPHLHMRSNNDPKQPPSYCPLHPQQLALHHLDHQNRQKFCTRCVILHNQDAVAPQEVQLEKKKQLEQFRTTIKTFGLRMEDAESSIREWGFSTEQKFFEWKGYIEESFTVLAEEIEQKKRELLSSLFESQQRINSTLGSRRSSLQEMRCALSRYLEDIENNYQDIIEDLSYTQFEDIMDKYNAKVEHFDRSLQQIRSPLAVNVFIPKKDIQKNIDRSTLTFVSHFEQEEACIRTLQRYPTEKHSFNADGSHRNLESVGGKISQHRQSRDRQHYCQPRKENLHNYANIFCR